MIFKQFLAEFIGLAIFVFIGGLSARFTGSTIVAAAAHGLTIALLIMAIGHISGGHLNPAVTMGLLIQGTAPLLISILFIIAQLSGAFIGGIMIWAVLRGSEYARIAGGAIAVNIASGSPAAEYQSVFLEIFLTFVLVYTVLMTAVDRDDNALAPLAIGLAVFVGIIAGGDISGASMNPARSFGPLVMYSFVGNGHCKTEGSCQTVGALWRTHYIHWVGPLVGGAIAAVLYRFLLASKQPSKQQ
jgi:aquaporin-8/aquaporin related protein